MRSINLTKDLILKIDNECQELFNGNIVSVSDILYSFTVSPSVNDLHLLYDLDKNDSDDKLGIELIKKCFHLLILESYINENSKL